jgi:hypothetical protein
MTSFKSKNDITSDGSNSNNVNRNQPVYYKNELHYILSEFDDKIIISKNKDLTKAFCVRKISVTIKPTKK